MFLFKLIETMGFESVGDACEDFYDRDINLATFNLHSANKTCVYTIEIVRKTYNEETVTLTKKIYDDSRSTELFEKEIQDDAMKNVEEIFLELKRQEEPGFDVEWADYKMSFAFQAITLE